MPQGPLAAAVAKLPSGALGPMSMDAQSSLAVSDFHGRKYELAHNGLLFRGTNTTGVTTSIALATTYVGCCLSNPAGNTVNLAVRKVFGNVNVAFAALTSYGLIVGYAAGGITVHTTPLTPVSSKIGTGPAATAKLDSACTLVGTPAWGEFIQESPAATNGTSFSLDLEGGLLLPPGAYVAIGSSIAGPTSGLLAGFEWEEIPV